VEGVVIDGAERDDLPALVGLLGELFSLERDFAPDAHKQTCGLLLILDHPERGQIFVARRNNEVIGMANVLFTVSTAEGGPVILLEDVIVARPYRRYGVGSALVRHVLDWADRNGFLRVTLLADSENAGAVRFYERNGLRRAGMVVLRHGLDGG
jgi:GNAT superfamily N-acetyltransferase